MNIIAIWERPEADKRRGGVFCLTKEGRFLHIYQETIQNKITGDYDIETGNPEIWNAFNEKINGKLWDFRCADYMIKAFGGVLIWKAK